MNAHRLSDYIEHELEDTRLERLWTQVDQERRRVAAARKRMRVATWGALAVAAGVLLGWVVKLPFLDEPRLADTTMPDEAPSPPEGATFRARAETMTFVLADGSNVQLAPRSRVALQTLKPQELRLALGDGELTCDVTKNDERDFFVMAGPVHVRVVGTKFTVRRSKSSQGEKISVAVLRGIVEVSGPDGSVKKLSGGESWSIVVASSQRTSDGAEPDESTKEPDQVRPPATTPPPRSSRPTNATPPPIEHDWFGQARAARRAGNASRAARLYEKFLSEASDDGRAGVAALELGRLKMDQLGDVRGAIPWLSRAASLGAGGLGDDALARLVQAHARLGQTAACKKMRARYLEAYPKGVHLRQVETLCP